MGRPIRKIICKVCKKEGLHKGRQMCATCYNQYHKKNCVIVSFIDYPEILIELEKSARRNFRTMQQEILFVIHESIQERADEVMKIGDETIYPL